MKTKTSIELGILAALGVVLSFYVYDRLHVRMAGTPSPLASTYATEEDWILHEIIGDIAAMCAFARSGGSDRGAEPIALTVTPSPSSAGRPAVPPTVGVQVRGGSISLTRTLSIDGSLWDPANYAGLAAELSGPIPPGEMISSAAGGDTLLEELLEPRAAVIERANQRISSRLAASMYDAEAHEQAALLLGAFGLREAVYAFGDIRPVSNRISAHLALARALRAGDPPGPSGRFAEATLSALLGRQAEAVEALEELSKDASAARSAWVNALSMYATGDWRRPGGEPESLFERIQRFRALVATLGSTAAVRRMGPQELEDPADWGRIVTAAYSGDASDGRFVGSQMERELAELQEVWTLHHGGPLPPGRLVAALNEPAERFMSREGPRVLSCGSWAAFFQRHICGTIAAAVRHFRVALSLPGEAEVYGARADDVFDGLALFPVVEVWRTRRFGARVEDTVGMDATIELTRRRPELLNARNWDYMADTAAHMVRRWGMPRGQDWFSPHVLTTTAFDTPERFRLLKTKVAAREVTSALLRVAPRHRIAADFVLEQRRPAESSLEEVAELLGDRVEYDLGALAWLRRAADRPEDQRMALEKMCALSPNECVALGWELVRAERAEEAAAAFQRAVDEAPDRVYLCNNSGWLAHHYLDRGLREKALAIAEAAAAVYCGGGLVTMAELQERLGERREAERYYSMYWERYGDSNPRALHPLLGFYYRMARVQGLAEYERKLARAASDIFPRGIEPLPEAHDPEPPRDGLLIDGQSTVLEEAGLRGADVIVGLDGFRVRSLAQYDAILDFNLRTWDMKLRIWRQTRYLDLQARVFRRHLGVKVRTYGTPGPTIEHR